jgi:hypothetical protein
MLNASVSSDDPRITRWRADPVDYFVERLGVKRESIVWSELPEYRTHVWDGTPDPLAAILRGLVTHRRVGVESGVGTGKTFTLAGVVYWFLECFEPSEVISYAPKKDQLEKQMWKEIGKTWTRWHMNRPLATLDHLRLRMIEGSDAWSAYGYPVGVGADEQSAVKAQGAHTEHMLQMVEETPGVNGAIMEAILNTAVDEHNIVLFVGNPDHQLDTLHQTIAKTPGCLGIRISANDHPNIVCKRRIIPGAVTQISIDEKKTRYGGELAPLYRSRVRGISPAEAQDAVIKLDWCYRARDRGRILLSQVFPNDPTKTLKDLYYNALPPFLDGPRALGVDVANSKDGDKGAIARGRGKVLFEVESFPCPDPNQLGRRLGIEMRDQHAPIDADYIGVDGVGVGSGTINTLKEEGVEVQNLQGGSTEWPDVEAFEEAAEEFKNWRAAAYWLLRINLQHDPFMVLPDDEELFQDLCMTKWAPKGKVITCQDKQQLKKLLGRSPDKGDACVYWNWVRQVRGASTGGGDMVDF